MRDEDVETTIFEKWDEYVPIINNLSGPSELPDEYNALTVIDRKLRPSGTQAKAPPAFSFYQVYTYSACIYLVWYINASSYCKHFAAKQ